MIYHTSLLLQWYNSGMGTLYIVSTPIGNLEDITFRAIKTLFSVDVIACEDTRRTGLLLQELKKRYPYVSPSPPSFVRLDEYTEEQVFPQVIDALTQGRNVALVSDAGTPLVSDPGFRLVRGAIKQGIKVVSIPGPTAAIAALTVSGLPTDKFFFLGYPPEKSSHRIKLFESLSEIFKRPRLASARRGLDKSPTLVLYCAPHKLGQTLEDMKAAFGDIEVILARELTKVHEEVWRGTISKALEKFHNPIGEFVLLYTLKEWVQS